MSPNESNVGYLNFISKQNYESVFISANVINYSIIANYVC